MSKRTNGGGMVGQDLDDRIVKRRKLPLEDNDETTESTTQHGLELLDIIKKIVDKNGRLIATNFLSLPNKRLLPEYYQVIKMPIALDTIETKLKRREFPNLTSLESYLKRMVLNAKEFNEKGSLLYDDSERLRKVISNYMTKHNPTYKTSPGFEAFPTPLPAEEKLGVAEVGEKINLVDQISKKSNRTSKDPKTFRSSATPALSDSQILENKFEGLNFQQAQEKIVEDMITEKEWEEDDFGAFEPFINLPSRKEYKDYYSVITHPLSLKDLQKAVKGVRAKSPGVSEFKTWSAFEEEASYIWKNAFLYNEDNSDIFKLAIDLKEFFTKLLQQAKVAVPEPVSTKIKLRMPEPTKITLKINRKSSPIDSNAPQLASISTAQSQNRQSNSNGLISRNPTNNVANPLPVIRPEQAVGTSRSAPSPINSASTPVNNQENSQNSPTDPSPKTNSSIPITPLVMPPPTSSISSNINSHGGYAQSFVHQSQPAIPLNSKFRLPGKSASDAMITNLSIATHPGLNIIRHFRMDLPPSATLAHQSVTINLPATHYYLQIKPSIASSMMQRQHKLFVTAGTTRLHAMPTIPGHPVEPRNPLFEARLHPGVNRIEIEIIAAFPKVIVSSREYEIEKITIFVNLMKV